MSKAYIYNTYKESDSIQQVPNVIVWGVPFARPSSYDYAGGVDLVSGISIPQALEDKGVVIVKGVTQVTTSSSKRSHTSQLQVQCIDEANEYMGTFSPGDWFFCSMFSDPATYNDVLQRLKAVPHEPINGFNDGLKFVGRVQAVRRTVNTNPMTGQKTRRVTIIATGFSEFDTTIYYDPALTINSTHGEKFAHDFLGSTLTGFGAINTTNGALPVLINSLVGKGPASGSKIEAPRGAFNIPTLIGKLLGTTQKEDDRPHLTYSAILVGIFGIQKYIESDGFNPSLKQAEDGSMRYRTPLKLSGTFANQLTPWVNVPIWGVLNNFLMPSINEIYTCLRVDPTSKRVLPHIIARQIPFNTEKANNDYPHTKFLNLPRWKIEDAQIINYDVVKTNSLRCNYVQVRSQAAIQTTHNESLSRSRIHPAWDRTDISRSGLVAQFTTTNNMLMDPRLEQHWTALIADRSMDGHLKFSGQIATLGIQAPICEGDNLQYDNLVFHIEGIQHSFVVNPQNGQKRFMTTILVSNGVPADGSILQSDLFGLPDPESAASKPQTTLE